MEDQRTAWLASVDAAADEQALRQVEDRLLGKAGAITELVKSVAKLPREERPTKGKAFNQLKVEVQKAIEARRAALAYVALAAELEAANFDPTEPGPPLPKGSLHPITIVQNDVIELFTALGFTWQDGPEIESPFHNFEALNIPDDHPARDSHDTFWLTDGTLLRTHTSPVQIRSMLGFEPPLKVIVPGRCFRNETLDASHEHTFYQVEGLVVDRGVSVAHLIHTMKTMLGGLFGRSVDVRLRPGFFPFVEPGFELDMQCSLCSGSGCPACKQVGWLELMGCGMVHPKVLTAGGIDPEEWSGFAFGLGLSRVAMMRYGIPDVRLFQGGDVRFLRQFEEVER